MVLKKKEEKTDFREFNFIMYFKRIGKVYSYKEAPNWSAEIVNKINRRIKDLQIPSYKHVVQIMLAEQMGSGCRYIAKSFWDNTSDIKMSQPYHSDSIFSVVTVFGNYQH